jgi:hypothetical protein
MRRSGPRSSELSVGSSPFVDELAERAMAALRDGDPKKAAVALRDALRQDPSRIDLLHALAVTELRRGEALDAYDLTVQGQQLAAERQDEASEMLMPQLLLVRAAACEELADPRGAEVAYREILTHEPQNPRARQGFGHLLLASGRREEGVAQLQAYLDDAVDQPEFLGGTAELLGTIRRLLADDVHPRMFIEAHRESYVEFFDHHAARQAALGWIAEAARMKRAPDGRVVPIIPDGARPYAGVRIDLVDPSNGQPGQVGDQPMVVALSGYEALAQAPVLLDWPAGDYPFPIWISTQCPWDQLPVQVRFRDAGADAAAALDSVLGDWYTAGFDGKFGTADRGRFHYVSDPEEQGEGRVLYHVDLGRAELSAIPDLLLRLAVLHERHAIAHVLLGRGQLPA